jgi:arylformamidase
MSTIETFKEIIDISLPISSSTVVYPGNPLVRIEEHKGATSTHSLISFGSHTATHIDAPKHCIEGAPGLEAYPLSQLIGSARVFDFTSLTEKITVDDLLVLDINEGDRILCKTRNSERGFTMFYDDYIYLDGDAADWLVEKKIAAFGIDALSIKKRGGSDHRPHTSLLAANIVIIEGLDLSKVDSGDYTLICLPLKFTNIDGSPARAVLLK